MEIDFPYRNEESDVFGDVKRPRIKMKIFSNIMDDWIVLDEVLADTGADFCMVPRYIGEMLVEEITDGISDVSFGNEELTNRRFASYTEIKGVVPGAKLIAYVHDSKIKLADLEFKAPVAIADSDDTPIIFGRVKALDLFDANFMKGETTRLSCDKT